MTVIDTVAIFYGKFEVGQITVEDNGKLSFDYDPHWIQTKGNFPLSTTMPIDHAQYEHTVILPWLSNLLPEEDQLVILSEALRISSADPLAILKEIGGDTAGAISIGEPSMREDWQYSPLSAFYGTRNEEEALLQHLADLGRRPFVVGEDGIRLSLAGGQKKSALAVLDANGDPKLGLPEEGDQLALPMYGAPSTIIVKPANERTPGIVENEAYCLCLANLIGIDAAKTSIMQAGDQKLLIVARYDRTLTKNGRIKRLHQEDFAQANSIYPNQKYEQGTIPGLPLKQLLKTSDHLAPTDKLRLMDQVIYNILVANTDAHAKNYSILLNDTILAPLYDVSTVLHWPQINQYYAQKLAGQRRQPKYLAARHWDEIAKEIGSSPSGLKSQVQKLVDAMVANRNAAVDAVANTEYASRAQVEIFADVIERHALRIAGQLG